MTRDGRAPGGRPRPESVIQFVAGLVVLAVMLVLSTERDVSDTKLLTLGLFALVLMSVPIPDILRPGRGTRPPEDETK